MSQYKFGDVIYPMDPRDDPRIIREPQGPVSDEQAFGDKIADEALVAGLEAGLPVAVAAAKALTVVEEAAPEWFNDPFARGKEGTVVVDQTERLEQENQTLRAEAQRAAGHFDRLETENGRLRQDVSILEADLKDLRRRLAESEQREQTTDNANRELVARVANLEVASAELQKRAAELTAQIALLKRRDAKPEPPANQ